MASVEFPLNILHTFFVLSKPPPYSARRWAEIQVRFFSRCPSRSKVFPPSFRFPLGCFWFAFFFTLCPILLEMHTILSFSSTPFLVFLFSNMDVTFLSLLARFPRVFAYLPQGNRIFMNFPTPGGTPHTLFSSCTWPIFPAFSSSHTNHLMPTSRSPGVNLQIFPSLCPLTFILFSLFLIRLDDPLQV